LLLIRFWFMEYVMFTRRKECFRDLRHKFFSYSTGQDEVEILKETAVTLCESVFRNVGPPYWYTDHGVGHSDRVLYYALRIARSVDDYALRLNDVEALALACACYLHDLGMAHMPTENNVWQGWPESKILHMRSWHVDAIEEILHKYRNKLEKLYNFEPILEGVLPQVCRAHGTKSHKDACEKLSKTLYGSFRRGDLLGKILLLADELDLTQERSMVEKHPQFEQFPCKVMAHHFKHYYVVEVQVSLPQIRLIFGFPENMSQENRFNFKKWTCQKIQDQIKLVSENLSGDWRGLFDIMVVPAEDTQQILKKECPVQVCDLVERLVDESKVAIRMEEEFTKHRPHYFYPERIKPSEPGPMYSALSLLMDDFFRECNTSRVEKFFRTIYIRIPQNEKISEQLISLHQKYIMFIQEHGTGRSSQDPFVIVGHTGVGKSTLLLNLEFEGRLCTRFYEGGHGMIVVRVDCLNLRSFTEVVRAMLVGLVNECMKKDWIWSLLRSEAWAPLFKPSSIAMLPSQDTVSILRGVLDLLHKRYKSSLKSAVPVCFVLDNIDRMPGFSLKSQVVTFAAREGKSKGFPFFVITLRSGTKFTIDGRVDDIAALASHGVIAPSPSEVLHSRLKLAFSDEVVGQIGSWRERAVVESSLGKLKLTFMDLRNSLEVAMKTLCVDHYRSLPPFIPSIAGNNIRNALTLYRAIIKSVDEKELLVLSRKHFSQHGLIKRAMIENRPCYFESASKIRNLFSCGTGEFYFLRIYILRFLRKLQLRTKDFVSFREWTELVMKYDFDIKNFKNGAWSLMTGNFPLLEVEGTDDILPNDRFRNVEDLEEADVEVSINPAGDYYLSYLMFDIAYLGCVLQDTLLDYDLAKNLGKPQYSLTLLLEQVEIFLGFLAKREVEERIAWRIDGSVPLVIPEVVKRVEYQKRALLER